MSELVHIANIRGIKRALEVCERMMNHAPTREEQRKRDALKREQCVLCDGYGFLEVQDNCVRVCDCRAAAVEAARARELEREKPQKDLVDYLLDDPEECEE